MRVPLCCCRCPRLPIFSVYRGFMGISAVACRPSCLVVFQISRSAPRSLVPWQKQMASPHPNFPFSVLDINRRRTPGEAGACSCTPANTRFECDASELMRMLIGCCYSISAALQRALLTSFSLMRWTPGRLTGRPPATHFSPPKHFFPGLFSPRTWGQNGGESPCSLTAASLQRSRQTNSELAAICHGARGARVLLWSLLWYWKQQLSGHAAALTTQRAHAAAAQPPGTTHTIWHTPRGTARPQATF